MDREELSKKKKDELRELCKQYEIVYEDKHNKTDLVNFIMAAIEAQQSQGTGGQQNGEDEGLLQNLEDPNLPGYTDRAREIQLELRKLQLEELKLANAAEEKRLVAEEKRMALEQAA